MTIDWLVGFTEFNATFNNISVISWQLVLLVEETGGPGENHRPVASQEKFYQIMLYWVHLAWAGFELTTSGVIGSDCIGSFKSNYHTITATTDPKYDNRRRKTRRTIITWTKTTGFPKIMETVNYYKSILFIYQFSQSFPKIFQNDERNEVSKGNNSFHYKIFLNHIIVTVVYMCSIFWDCIFYIL